MTVQIVYLFGCCWLDSENAAKQLGISAKSLRRNCTRIKDLRDIDNILWHHVRLWKLDDVMTVSMARYSGDLRVDALL